MNGFDPLQGLSPELVREAQQNLSPMELRRKEICENFPWLEGYEVDAILIDEGYDVFSQEKSDSVSDMDWTMANYAPLYVDSTNEEYGAYTGQDDDKVTEAAPVISSEDKEALALRERSRAIMTKNIKQEAGKMGVALLCYVVVQLLLGAGITMYMILVLGWKLMDIVSFLNTPANMLLMQGVILVMGLGVPFVMYAYIYKLPTTEIVPFHKLRRGELWNMVWLGLGANMLIRYILNAVETGHTLVGGVYNYQLTTVGRTGIDIVYSIICLIIIPSIIEEFVFRGIVLQVLRRRGGDTFGIIVSSLLCGLIYSNVNGIGAFVISLAVSYLVIFSGSLMPAIVINVVRSTLSVVLVILSSLLPENFVTYIDVGITVIFMLGALFAGAELLSSFPDFFRIKRSDTTLTLREKLTLTVTRPSVLLLIIYALVFGLLESISAESILSIV